MPIDVSQGTIDASRPVGLYVHFPFCSVRCPYCDFAIDTRPVIPHRRYADAVVAELEARHTWFCDAALAGPGLVSIYFGGGTPGLWDPSEIHRVIAESRRVFGVAESTPLEITVEANPGESTSGTLSALREAGVNRVSLGVQSFDDGLLKVIGRNHDARGAREGIAAARDAGFQSVCCDLMFGLPGQSLPAWQRAIDALVALGPEHISCYGLTIERGTPFGAMVRAGKLANPDEDLCAQMYAVAQSQLAAAGYAQYEVSNHARDGHRARHNQLYWTQGAYLGIGCSSASFRPLRDGRAFRFTNPRATDTYLSAVEAGAGEFVPAQSELRLLLDLENEALWLALRTKDGVDRPAFSKRFGVDPLATQTRAAAAARCVERGWIEVTEKRIVPTTLGFLFADELAVELWD
ncbi:MAG: radical SAM family heme chaperone HemW [Deltaproteobacteria bacterium]|nr:radical SAM family heme chaperone HemW [Deltaproteobacteria bacterium]